MSCSAVMCFLVMVEPRHSPLCWGPSVHLWLPFCSLQPPSGRPSGASPPGGGFLLWPSFENGRRGRIGGFFGLSFWVLVLEEEDDERERDWKRKAVLLLPLAFYGQVKTWIKCAAWL